MLYYNKLLFHLTLINNFVISHTSISIKLFILIVGDIIENICCFGFIIVRLFFGV